MVHPNLPEPQGLYDGAHEHDACGVGFVANIKSKKSHDIGDQGLTILRNLTHRGAVKAYGLDMTSEMLPLARENQRRSGLTNVEFLKGEIEHIPLPDESVDVVISNCVINLSADKPQVLREAYRVLAPGGRFAVSDVVLRGDLPPAVRRSVALFTGCVSGALTEGEYLTYLGDAGFTDAGIEPTRIYDDADVAALLDSAGLQEPGLLEQVSGRVMSAFARARRPGLAEIKASPHAEYIALKFWADIAAGEDKHQKMVVKGEERAWFFVYELQKCY